VVDKVNDKTENDKKNKTFEEALSRLETLVAELEEGQVSLERALQLYAEGVELVRLCRRKLERAEQRISLLSESVTGELVLSDCNLNDKGSGVEG